VHGLPIDDFAPYLSIDLKQQMDGRVSFAAFKPFGVDPDVSQPNMLIAQSLACTL